MRGRMHRVVAGFAAVVLVSLGQAVPSRAADPAAQPAAGSGAEGSGLADIAQQGILLEVVLKNYCYKPGGPPGQVFNLKPVLANKGAAATGPFLVIVESAPEEAGPYEQAGAGEIVPDVKPGEKLTLRPFQYHNCQGARWFRVTLDSQNEVKESNEGNNVATIRY